VLEELHHPRTTAAVRTWLASTPSWLVVEQVDEPFDPQLARLDPGERQAIQLAKRAQADLLLMDERLGVHIARAHGLAVTGTLGTLLQPARRGLVDIDCVLADLKATDFRCSDRVIEEVRRRAKA
jgi:predicted nucleic acid-binding protein